MSKESPNNPIGVLVIVFILILVICGVTYMEIGLHTK